MSPFQEQLRRILADRHSPEAGAFYQTLLGYIHRRVAQVARYRCEGLLSDSDHEELIGEVLYQLMQGSLARFRGDSLGELLAFVRTICDRTTWRAAERRLRERVTVEQLADEGDVRWTRSPERIAADRVEVLPDSPLPDDDQRYLQALLQAGSKADLARAIGVSRAAVTQRIQRIQQRVAGLNSRDRAAHEAWLEHEAGHVLAARAGPS